MDYWRYKIEFTSRSVVFGGGIRQASPDELWCIKFGWAKNEDWYSNVGAGEGITFGIWRFRFFIFWGRA